MAGEDIKKKVIFQFSFKTVQRGGGGGDGPPPQPASNDAFEL